jgi:nucleotide-binding universal stress UspA family protein
MKPFESILFAADFSENSREAFTIACSLALEKKTKMVVLHVVEPDWIPVEPVYLGQASVQYYREGPTETRQQALERKLCEFYAPSHALDLTYEIREGEVAPEILRMAQELESSLIVMGTHGRTGLRRLLTGSVAIAVLRGAHRPVLALRAALAPRTAEPFKLILHPTDFSTGSEYALKVARSLARDLGARLALLHVAPIPVYGEGTMAAELDPEGYWETLEEIRNRVDGPDLKYQAESHLARGDATEEIIRIADELGCGLIVMGTHGRTGLGRLLMGNVAESVLPRAHCPVLVVKQPLPKESAHGSERPAEKMISVY